VRGKEGNNLSLNEKIRKLTIFKKELSEAHKNRVLVDRDDVLGLLEGYDAKRKRKLQQLNEQWLKAYPLQTPFDQNVRKLVTKIFYEISHLEEV